AQDATDTAVGNGATVGADSSTAVGDNAVIDAVATNSVAVGANTHVSAASGTAVGEGATVSAAGAVALGQGSVASEANTVSVGNATQQRRITNVAAGQADTDAVNVGQLDAVTQQAVDQAKTYADNGDKSTLAQANAYTNKKFAEVVNNRAMDKFRNEVNGRFANMGRRIDQVGAMGAAMAQMAFSTQGVDTPNRMGVGVANYHGEQAIAVGYSRSVSQHVNITFGAAHSGDGTQAGVGVGFGW
ncbi:MAG TPA: YadA-like family protein, partial [Rhodanobacteraceae bacterium]|nr:YadA-like family protein [Rhodanobacteraceae bacterium]